MVKVEVFSDENEHNQDNVMLSVLEYYCGRKTEDFNRRSTWFKSKYNLSTITMIQNYEIKESIYFLSRDEKEAGMKVKRIRKITID